MNGLDFALLAFLVVPTLLGFKSGLIRMAANLGGIIVGIMLAGQFGGQLADIISPLIGDRESLAKILGFVIVIGIS
ncbi:MAG: CvpA family protein [Chloroflexi bacterium]|nr:CvpA family protein [Chloroflexota bacterium]